MKYRLDLRHGALDGVPRTLGTDAANDVVQLDVGDDGSGSQVQVDRGRLRPAVRHLPVLWPNQGAEPLLDLVLINLIALFRRVQVRNANTKNLRDGFVGQLKLDHPVFDLLPDEGQLGLGQVTVDQGPERQGNAIAAIPTANSNFRCHYVFSS